MRSTFYYLFLLVMLSVGCQRAGVTTGSEGVSWIHASDDAVSGIDIASVERVTRADGDQPVQFVLWTDKAKSFKGKGTTEDYKSTITMEDGDTIKLSLDVATRLLVMNAKQFDLANGQLFLISSNGELRIKQLDRSVAEMQIDSEWLQRMADDDQEIRDFFSSPGALRD